MNQAPPNTTEIAPGVVLPDAALSFSFSRSGGPGGQNVNKVNTRATLTVSLDALAGVLPPYALRRLQTVAARYLAPGGVQISVGDSRSQAANRRECIARLRAVVVEAMNRPKIRKRTKPSARAVQRRLDAKKHRSNVKRLRRSRGD